MNHTTRYLAVLFGALGLFAVTAPVVGAQNGSDRTCFGETVTVDLGAGELPTEGDDIILGTSGDDVIDGLGGRDFVCSLGGDDVINVPFGMVKAGPGNDMVETYDCAHTGWYFGGPGDDTLTGGGTLVGGDGADRLQSVETTCPAANGISYGGAGDDVLIGTNGVDFLNGGDGNDLLEGLGGRDYLRGDDGDDTLKGGQGRDRIRGGDGNDSLYGGPGRDLLLGGDGSDACKSGRKKNCEK